MGITTVKVLKALSEIRFILFRIEGNWLCIIPDQLEDLIKLCKGKKVEFIESSISTNERIKLEESEIKLTRFPKKVDGFDVFEIKTS